MRKNVPQPFAPENAVADAYFALDTDWRFTFVSAEAQQILARTSDDLLGHSLWEEYPQAVGIIYEEKYRQAMSTQTPTSFETYIPNMDTWFEFRAYPAPSGLSVYFRDVSREHRTAEALRTSENRLALAAEAAGIGWFNWDAATGHLFWSDRCKAIFGLPPETVMTSARFQERIHPEDREWVERDVQEAIANRTDHTIEYRAIRPDGVMIWVAAKGHGRYDATGKAILFEGIAQDVTERKNLEIALEAERQRVLDRERHIAEVLKTALQPELPRIVPGLDLAFFFKAALEEASIGGDFADVFSLDHERTALVVGDLSGKGLAAASQVATVRNMLRSFLYSEPTLVQAVTKLNRIVVQQDLLTGFVTLFVASYRADDRHLQFVSCGHEPGLVRRAATGQVEELAPTGTILGADEDAVYQEQVVRLSSNDALLLYTDGLTEAGRSFREFLGVDGMIDLFTASQATDATSLVTEIVGGVQEHAHQSLRDDACLLAAVVR